jgi:hypothetical protein
MKGRKDLHCELHGSYKYCKSPTKQYSDSDHLVTFLINSLATSTTPPKTNTHRGSLAAVVLGRGGGGGAEVVVSSGERRPLGDRPPADPRSDRRSMPLFGTELVAVAR